MIELLRLLGLVGLVLIVTHGAAFARVRSRVGALACAQCVGFWVGAADRALRIAAWRPWHLAAIEILIGAGAVSLAAFVIARTALDAKGEPS